MSNVYILIWLIYGSSPPLPPPQRWKKNWSKFFNPRFKNFGVFDEIVMRPELNIPQNDQNPNLLLRPWITKTFTKLNIWTLTSYTKIVYLDTDVLVLKNIDDLFQRDELSAGPEDLWPDVFNSGVLVIEPSMSTFTRLIKEAKSKPSWDGMI